MATERAHPALHELLERLQGIYEAVSSFQPYNTRPPILDSSLSLTEAEDDSHPSHQDHIPGLKKLKESLKLDLDGLQKFLDDPNCANRPPPSTNAPYLISVWNELLCAPPPVVSLSKMFLFEPKGDQPPSASSKAAVRRRNNGTKPPGAKADVVADAGKVWIRVNTIKNSRLLAEFREIDSYNTDSEEDSDWDDAGRPTLAQAEFDNSVLKMGRALVQAAHVNPIVEGMHETPRITMRLTRLDPTITDGPEADPRIGRTIEMLKDMGVEVQLGERTEQELVLPSSRSEEGEVSLVPSQRINLDLSVLIALISEMTHAPLPTSVEDANKRFIPPKEYLDWKQTRRKKANKDSTLKGLEDEDEDMTVDDLPHDLATHSRALTHQLLGEMGKSMIQEIRNRIGEARPGLTPDVEFWVTTEARDRCIRIVSKIGAVNEKRRAYALFCIDPSDPSQRLSLEKAEELFWQNSRFNKTLSLFPLRFHSSSLPPENSIFADRANRQKFFKELAGTCQHILDQETMPHPNARPSPQFQFISQRTPFPPHPSQHYNANGNAVQASEPLTAISDPPRIDLTGAADEDEEIQRAVVTKANPRLTAHTVESMLWGAELGWTTLTANRTSVRAILKEIRVARVIGKLEGLDLNSRGEGQAGDAGGKGQTNQVAALWIVDPRSLAEQMCGQSLYGSNA